MGSIQYLLTSGLISLARESLDLCVDDYEEGSGDCQAAMADLAECVDGRGCLSVEEHCVSESLDYLQECF